MSSTTFYPSADEINSVFSEQVIKSGGRVTERFHGNDSIYIRATLNLAEEVFPGDIIDGGVAVRAVGPGVSIHPFTFRRICTNGAVIANPDSSVDLVRSESNKESETSRVHDKICSTIKSLVDGQAFNQSVLEMRLVQSIQMDQLPRIMRAINHFSITPEIIDKILERFFRHEPQTGYGLMNAITAMARKERDAERKWNLERIGGGVPAFLLGLPEVDEAVEAKQIPQPIR